MMKATGKILVTEHTNDCPGLKTASKGRGTPAQRSPWFFNRGRTGTRSGPADRGNFRWFEFRCRGNSCEAVLLLREDYLLARTINWKFSA